MDLSNAIDLLHEAVEGRYDLTGNDLQEIHDLLCTFQEKEEIQRPNWLTSDICRVVKLVYSRHKDLDDACRLLQSFAMVKTNDILSAEKAKELFKKFC